MPRRAAIREKLLGELRRLVTAGFRPGEALPPQHALGAMHGVGQATAHRALQALAREGLVEARGGCFRPCVRCAGPGNC